MTGNIKSLILILARSGFVIKLPDNISPNISVILELLDDVCRKHILYVLDISVVVFKLLLKHKFYIMYNYTLLPCISFMVGRYYHD